MGVACHMTMLGYARAVVWLPEVVARLVRIVHLIPSFLEWKLTTPVGNSNKGCTPWRMSRGDVHFSLYMWCVASIDYWYTRIRPDVNLTKGSINVTVISRVVACFLFVVGCSSMCTGLFCR